jgi:hypothetical protein
MGSRHSSTKATAADLHRNALHVPICSKHVDIVYVATTGCKKLNRVKTNGDVVSRLVRPSSAAVQGGGRESGKSAQA